MNKEEIRKHMDEHGDEGPFRILKDFYDIDGRLAIATSALANTLPPHVLELLEDIQVYLGWTIVQNAMNEAQERQMWSYAMVNELPGWEDLE